MTGMPEQYKSRLQEFTQRANISFPIYHTTNEGGPHHLPQFRSSVEVDGETYTSLDSFSNKKAAEQDAARLALEGISKKIKDCISKKTTDGGFPPIHQDKVFCKSILHEFAAKMNMDKPKYDTDRVEGPVPVFVSSVIFNGVKYVGGPSVNKKEAEQLAARAVVLAILVDSGVGMHLSEIVKSKAKLFSVVHENLYANVETGVSPLQPNSETALGTSAIKGDNEGTGLTGGVISNVVALPLPEQSASKKGVLEGADQAGTVTENVVSEVLNGESHVLPRLELENPVLQTCSEGTDQVGNVIGSVSEVHEEQYEQSHVQPRHEYRKPVPETYTPAVPLPIAFVSSLQDQIPLNASASGGKRKSKKRKKAKKKAKADGDTSSELPLSQGVPCSVTQ